VQATDSIMLERSQTLTNATSKNFQISGTWSPLIQTHSPPLTTLGLT
jgi:hypothetical protein